MKGTGTKSVTSTAVFKLPALFVSCLVAALYMATNVSSVVAQANPCKKGEFYVPKTCALLKFPAQGPFHVGEDSTTVREAKITCKEMPQKSWLGSPSSSLRYGFDKCICVPVQPSNICLNKPASNCTYAEKSFAVVNEEYEEKYGGSSQRVSLLSFRFSSKATCEGTKGLPDGPGALGAVTMAISQCDLTCKNPKISFPPVASKVPCCVKAERVGPGEGM